DLHQPVKQISSLDSSGTDIGHGRWTASASVGQCPAPSDTVGELKKLIAAQTGTDASKIVLKK
ncbi:10091_t:CDS:2, partial [Racocetra persica]